MTHFPDEVRPVPVDDVLIEQVLVNLIENAARYTPARTPIEISVFAEGDETTVEVADRGPGIREEDHERIFHKFYRGSHSVGDGGVGLGLTISRAIVRAHGGELSVHDRAGGGAAFRLRLPHEPRTARSPDPLPEVSAADRSASQRS
jgi:two-component system, OmpR family, sensor histidine kinase KdpD